MADPSSFQPSETLVEAFEREMAKCYACQDLPPQFQKEKFFFRLGWGDHTAGCQSPIGSNLHRRRGWEERKRWLEETAS